MIPENPKKEITNLPVFKKFCSTIGELPSSYLISMTYEEQLLWFSNYLTNTVIPSINNNAEAVIELQNLFIELKDYVDNYFKNLDVTTEIQNKIQELVEEGLIRLDLGYTYNEEEESLTLYGVIENTPETT